MTTESGKTTQAQMIAKKIAAELNKVVVAIDE